MSAKAYFGGYLPEAHDAGSVYSCDGRAEAAAAVEKLTKRAETKQNATCGLGPFLALNSKRLASIDPILPHCDLGDIWSRSQAAAWFYSGTFAARFSPESDLGR
jgi:hypothetical protein